ncbi:spindle pole body component 110-like [Penaeus japonicus]|uniref:spindle pole body component 110-like n=1 Tax=Penaeus japonicus TaxID=27405 RepID=UPI001C714027|nr:spindle pole body component 110-like [Penaeus japonicus]
MSATEEAGSEQPQQTEASDEMKGARLRVLTEKGREYQITQLSKRLLAAKQAWRKALTDIMFCLESVISVDQLRIHKKAAVSQFNEVVTAFILLIEVDPNSQEKLSQELNNDEKVHETCLHQIESKMNELKQETNSVKSHSSKLSRHSQSTNRSSQSINKKEQLLTKIAKLQTELQFREREMEHKKNLVIKDLVATQAELNIVNATEDEKLVLPECEEVDNLSKTLHLHKYLDSLDSNPVEDREVKPSLCKQEINIHDISGMAELEKEVSKLEYTYLPSPVLNPQAKSFKPESELKRPHVSTRQDRTSSLVDINVLREVVDILSSKNKNELPRPEPEVFSGDLLEFPTWLQNFEIFIESRVTKPAEKLFYLGKYTSGAAKEAIRGLLRIHNEEAFREAKGILEDRYGNKFIVTKCLLEKTEKQQDVIKVNSISNRKVELNSL